MKVRAHSPSTAPGRVHVMSEIDVDELLRELAVLVDEERRVSTCVLSALSSCNSCLPIGLITLA